MVELAHALTASKTEILTNIHSTIKTLNILNVLTIFFIAFAEFMTEENSQM